MAEPLKIHEARSNVFIDHHCILRTSWCRRLHLLSKYAIDNKSPIYKNMSYYQHQRIFHKKNVLDYNINVFTQGLVHSMCAINFSSCFIARGIAQPLIRAIKFGSEIRCRWSIPNVRWGENRYKGFTYIVWCFRITVSFNFFYINSNNHQINILPKKILLDGQCSWKRIYPISPSSQTFVYYQTKSVCQNRSLHLISIILGTHGDQGSSSNVARKMMME